MAPGYYLSDDDFDRIIAANNAFRRSIKDAHSNILWVNLGFDRGVEFLDSIVEAVCQQHYFDPNTNPLHDFGRVTVAGENFDWTILYLDSADRRVRPMDLTRRAMSIEPAKGGSRALA